MNRLTATNSTCSVKVSQRRRLADVLEGYLADLERGAVHDEQALLAAHPELADELRPYLESLRLLHGATHGMRAARAVADAPARQSAAPGLRQIGEYRLVREIGRGGMGIVYEAHQTSLNRNVALKVLPFAAVLDQRQIARFRNEAQAAAQLHHPHIVPVFAVGQELGVYYYAMQYIDGQSLAEVIDAMKGEDQGAKKECKADTQAVVTASTVVDTSLAARSSLLDARRGEFFRTVARLGKEAAEALHHAHEYGIIHRDVKPSNLLLDGSGKLWVTDFGLARMQAENGVTLTRDVVGTLRYMSPEQAGGRAALVDARTDVYSLGVTLYELLTQRPAFTGDDRQTLMRQILGEEPLSPRRIDPAVPVDLETIVLSAMAKSREERYASAQALADDLERFLAGKPTLARRPTLMDRAAKWTRRHRPLVIVGVCAMLLLSIVSAIGMALLMREQGQTSAALSEAEQSAQAARASFARAERHFQQARSAVDQFGVRLADRLLELPGAESLRRDVLVDTLSYYRQFVAQAGDDPQLRHELALAHFKSGVLAAKLGDATGAIAEYEEAQRLLGELTAGEPSQVAPRAQLALAHNNLGLLLAAQGDVIRAHVEYQSAIAIQKRLLNEDANDALVSSQMAESQANLALLLDQTGDRAAAERSLRAAVDVLRPLAEASAGEPTYRRDLAIASNNLSFILRNHDAAAAEDAAREATAILERLVEQFPSRLDYQDDLALCSNNLAALATNRGRLDEAIDRQTQAISLHERLVRKAPAVVRHRSDLAVSLSNLGMMYCRAQRPAEADAAFGRARELLTTLADDYPGELAYQSALAALLNNQALALAGAGRQEDALATYPIAIEAQRLCWQSRPDSPSMRELLSKMYYNYGQSLRAAGRPDDAIKAALARRDVWRKNGERLLGVAVELAEISTESLGGSESSLSADARRELDNEVVATLWQARESGWPRDVNLASDERFAHLRNNERFAELIAALK